MKFTSALLSTLLTLTSAIPLSSRKLTPQSGIPVSGIYPTDISLYHVSSGAIDFNVEQGLVAKTGDGADITTLLTFDITGPAVGKTLTLHFYLDDKATVSGSGLLDVYSSLGPATQSTTGWGQGVPGNQRNDHLGRLSVNTGSEGTYLTEEEGFPQTAQAFEGPETEGVIAFELVGVSDEDHVTWAQIAAGAYLRYE